MMKNQSRILVKRVGCDLQEVSLPGDEIVYRDDAMKRFINTEYRVEYVPLTPDGLFCLAVDEDGLHKNLEQNFLLKMNSPYWPIQKIVGTAVFVRRKPVEHCGEIWDYEVTDLTDEDIDLANSIIHERNQVEWKSQFSDYGKGAMVCEPITNIEDFLAKCFGGRRE